MGCYTKEGEKIIKGIKKSNKKRGTKANPWAIATSKGYRKKHCS